MTAALALWALSAAELPLVNQVEQQPLAAQAARIADALDYLGAPLPAQVKDGLRAARSPEEIQKLLDPQCLVGVEINPEQRVKVRQGPAAPVLDESGWRTFLIKVANAAGTTAELKVESPHAAPIYKRSSGSPKPASSIPADAPAQRWMDAELYGKPPLAPALSGLELEYRVLQLYCGDRSLGGARAAGGPFKREGKLAFSVGQGTQDLGFRSELDVLFTCRTSVEVELRVRDVDGAPAMASFTIRDAAGRVYPAPAKRLAPDFFFHAQVYRKDGETVRLPAGKYVVEARRGPEYLVEESPLTVPADGRKVTAHVQLRRWIDPARLGWISGDHHIHAAGCAHYEDPTQGVSPKDMWRHVLGEDLKVGCALTWGPCYYFQKRYFTGKVDALSTDRYVMRYDLEVSGWSSHRAGHLVLLRLKDQDYPGTKVLEDWPTLGLNVLRWAKAQGAVTGPAHSGWGLAVEGTQLPNYSVPRCDGIGANEYVVQVTHQVPGPGGKLVPAVDFMSTVDTPYTWELNMWYQTLNAGFRTRASGETDFPCIYGERVGLGRAYVKLDDRRRVDFDRWVDGVAAGRSYVSDGRSHLMDFTVGGVEVGTRGSELQLAAPGMVDVTAQVAALLNATPNPELKARPPGDKPYWDIERARIGLSRRVPLELVVNGVPVASTEIRADGVTRPVRFAGVRIERSSWVALRILSSSHTNPVFVVVAGKPIRASRRSIEWCLKTVDACWMQKRGTYRAEEQNDARAAYDHAREVYRQRLAETDVD